MHAINSFVCWYSQTGNTVKEIIKAIAQPIAVSINLSLTITVKFELIQKMKAYQNIHGNTNATYIIVYFNNCKQ